MPSRRARKRHRRLAASAGLRGDRTRPPTGSGGGGGSLCGDWESASPSDLLLLRKAIREGWPVPLERRRPLMEAALSPITRKGTPARLVIALGWLVVAADRANLECEKAEAAGADGPR